MSPLRRVTFPQVSTRMNSRPALVLAALLLSAVLGAATAAGAAPASERDDFDVTYGDNQWSGGSATADSSGFAHSRSEYTASSGLLRVFATSSSMGWASATSSVYKDFYYEHDHDWYNTFEITYSTHGMMGREANGANNFRVEATLYYLDADFNEHALLHVPDIGRTDFSGEVSFVNRVLVFSYKLRSHWRYRVRLTAFTRCEGRNVGESAFSDFFDDLEQQRYYVDLGTLHVKHTHVMAHTYGGVANGPSAVATFAPEQDDYYEATGIAFTSHTDDRYVHHVVGWDMQIADFDAARSDSVDDLSVHADAWLVTSPPIPYKYIGYIRIEHRLDHTPTCSNSVGWYGPSWSGRGGRSGRQDGEIMPDHEWSVLYPEALGGTENHYQHLFILRNSDPIDDLKISSMTFTATSDRYDTLSAVPFAGDLIDFVLPPGQDWSFPVITDGPLYGGYIYCSYRVLDEEGTSVISNAWGRHDIYPRPAEVTLDPTVMRGGILASLGPNPVSWDLHLAIAMERTAPLRLQVFDIGGRRIATVFDGVVGAGASLFIWEPRGADGRPIANGTYFLRVRGDGQAEARRFVIAR
jgi:hypothetical protein